MGKSNAVTVTVTPKEKWESELTCSVSPTTGVAPLTVTVEGYLRDAVTKSPIIGATVTIKVNDTPVTTAKTDLNGTGYYSAQITLQNPGIYTIYAEWEGNEWYKGC